MNQNENDIILNFFESELLQLNFKGLMIKKACKLFDLSKGDSTNYYNQVKSKIRNKALNRALIYLLLGSISLLVGITGTFGDIGFVFYGSLLGGLGMTISSIEYFKIYLTSSKHTVD